MKKMFKFLIKFLLTLVSIIILFIIYMNYVGVETSKFNDLIKKKTNDLRKEVKLEFKNTKIYLNARELNIIVKLQNPKILISNKEILLSKLNLFLSIKSYFNSDFLLEKAKLSFIKNDISDITKVTSIFVPKIINKKINKIFQKGKLDGSFIIPFESNGSVGKEYEFSGKINNASINLTKEIKLKNLTTDINHKKSIGGNIFNIIIENGLLYDLDLAKTSINITQENKETNFNADIKTKGKFNFSEIKKISSILNFNIEKFKDINGLAELDTNINFKINNNFRKKNLKYKVDGNISYMELLLKKKLNLNKYLPGYKNKIVIKNSIIKLNSSSIERKVELGGSIKINSKFNKFNLNEIYKYTKKVHDVNGTIDLTSSQILIPNLNYSKKPEDEANLFFDVKFVLNKYFNINEIKFINNKNKINLSKVKLNKNFEINDFKKIEVKTFKNEVKSNDFLINKSNKTTISGKVFDAEPLLKSLFNNSATKTFSKKFTSEIVANLNRVITGTDDEVKNFGMVAFINKGSYDKLSLKGKFSKDEILEMSIYQIDSNKKSIQVISDRARPFIKSFNFIKGFEGGKLQYESTIIKNKSKSNLKITDFKVSKVPVLAKLLTVASLQGIADTLSGEGIRFESFEMKSSSAGNLMNIDDALAMGPAVSILLEGYIEKNKVVSLRGTLVPATKLNAIIASIPIVGSILVGKKSGEGVVGVSFKMKGPPKDIKTTVNPIKTLTPRFIVRALENIKNKKKEKIK